MERKIFTIGHSNNTAEAFLALFSAHGIRLLVDIRSRPYSKYVPHFNKSEIEKLCREHGLEYVYLGHLLGGMPEDGAEPKEDTLRRGVEAAGELLGRGPVCLMCSEAMPEKCHRSRLLEPLFEAAGIGLVHILPDGSAADAADLRTHSDKGQLNLF